MSLVVPVDVTLRTELFNKIRSVSWHARLSRVYTPEIPEIENLTRRWNKTRVPA